MFGGCPRCFSLSLERDRTPCDSDVMRRWILFAELEIRAQVAATARRELYGVVCGGSAVIEETVQWKCGRCGHGPGVGMGAVGDVLAGGGEGGDGGDGDERAGAARVQLRGGLGAA